MNQLSTNEVPPNRFSKTPISDERWAKIKLLAIDVDGTLTDGSLCFDENGALLQTFNVRDGFALVVARRAGIQVAWISGRASKVAQKRFEELQLHHCLLKCADKAIALRDLQNEHGFSHDECCFIGDDLPDLPAFRECGINVAVADSVDEVLERADFVTRQNGGRGAVREVIERILGARGEWAKLVRSYDEETQTENLQK